MTTRGSLKNGDNCMAQRYACVACLIAMAIVLGIGTLASANPRYDAWQAQHPFIQTAWNTYPYEGGTIDVEYFLNSGLNTAWDGVRSGSWRSTHPMNKGLPILVMAKLAEQPDLAGFLADHKEAKQAHENIIGTILGDED